MMGVYMFQKFKKSLSLILLLLSTNLSHATQIIDKSDKGHVEVNVSAREQNRLVIEGRAISSVMPGQQGVLMLEQDNAENALYFRFNTELGSNPNPTATLFVTDEQGVSYKLIVVAKPMAGEEIVLRPPTDSIPVRSDSAGVRVPTGTHDRSIKNLLLAMSNHLEGTGIEVRKTNSPVALWSEALFVLTGIYSDTGLVGEEYQLTNVSRVQMVVAEQELYRNGVDAVAIDDHVLEPGESTVVFVIRERKSNE
jgi:conjugal transfer pilus assembly protein TraK